MKLHDLKPAPGSTHTSKRLGRGPGSGKGKTSGKGMGGQKARSGPNPYRTFEGGQNRLVRRLPYLRGFNNKWRVEYQVMNVGDLAEWPEGEIVSIDTLVATRTIKKTIPFKILGDGEITTPLTIEAHKFSASARQKIEAVGGTCVDVPWVVVPQSRSRGANLAMVNGRQGVRRERK